jgi:3-oxoacyl-[acyl-carrier protein] reductase
MTSDRVMLVTGASGSIGRVVAERAAADGWTVIAHGRTPGSAGKIAADIRERLPEAHIVPAGCDFVEAGAIAHLVDRIADEQGRLDAVAHCAVSAPPGVTGAFAGTDPAHYTMLGHHAVTTLQWLCHAAFPLMARDGGGSLVAISSDAGRFAAPNQSLIATTRAATMAFVRNVALEVARDRIRVNVVSATYVEDTAIMRLLEAGGSTRVAAARRRAGLGLPHPGDIANIALFLLGSGSTRLTGQVISVNGGLNS